MKLLVAACAVCMFLSCVKDPDHHVRVRNLSEHPITILIDDTIRFDSIAVQQKSVYKSIQEGSHQVGGDYFGNFVVEGTGTHKWTIEILDDGMNLVED
ncbi:MAG TPA: hypothetical protein PK734_06185 [Bacteroidales bacterium]|nr:MAG: hypothetical protein BWY22_00130 [Bacteroidetes bacterium ADurb.Bin217]HPM13058.1 hypothetical protein [Bacteroidales bacterium]